MMTECSLLGELNLQQLIDQKKSDLELPHLLQRHEDTYKALDDGFKVEY